MRLQVAVPVGILVLALGGAVGWLLHPVEECADYWPHKYPGQQPGDPTSKEYADKLEDIVTQALAAINAPQPPAPQVDQVRRTIGLALRCAWQDLPDHDSTHQGQHAIAVTKAWDYAKQGKWKECADALEGVGVNHPH